jgi:hypothetical protein
LIAKLTWEIESCKQQSAELQKEIQTAKKWLRKRRSNLRNWEVSAIVWQKAANMPYTLPCQRVA